jgi:hypothetical protein
MHQSTMKVSSHSDTAKTHYEAHSADSFEDSFLYEPGEYQDYLVSKERGRRGLNAHSLTVQTDNSWILERRNCRGGSIP